MSVFDIFTGKDDIQKSRDFVGALDEGIAGLQQKITGMPNFNPDLTNEREVRYAQNNLILEEDGSYSLPEKAMAMQKLDSLTKTKANIDAEYERKRSNPLFNALDVGADVFRNTVGLVPNMLTGGTAVTYDPSKKMDNNYRAAMSGLVDSQRSALSELNEARKTRAQAFAGGIGKNISVPFTGTDGFQYSTVDDGRGNITAQPVLDAEGKKVQKMRQKVVTIAGVPTLVDVNSVSGDQTGLTDISEVAENASVVANAESFGRGTGKAQAEATVAVDGARQAANSYIGVLQKLLGHEGLTKTIGTQTGGLRSKIAGSDEADFMALKEQVEGKLFLQAREMLKGAGSVTDFEGVKGQAAMGRLQRSQSVGAFREAIQEIITMVQNDLRNIERKAGGQFSTPSGTTYRVVQPPTSE
jgi:hypothetical protein